MTAGGGTTRPARVVVGARLVAVLAAAFAMLSWFDRDAAAEEAARVDALAAGPALVEDVLGYTPDGRRGPGASRAGHHRRVHDQFVEYERKRLYRSRKHTA